MEVGLEAKNCLNCSKSWGSKAVDGVNTIWEAVSTEGVEAPKLQGIKLWSQVLWLKLTRWLVFFFLKG